MSNIPRAIADTILAVGGLNLGLAAVTDGKVDPLAQLIGNDPNTKKLLRGAMGAAALYLVIDEVAHGFYLDPKYNR